MTDKEDIWVDDHLARKNDSALLYRLTYNRYRENLEADRKGSYVINVDAGWGQGKTFLLSRMHRELIRAGHPAVFINVWEHDYIDDPYTIVVAAIDDYIKSVIGAVEPSKAKKIKEAFDKFRRNFGKIVAVVGTELTKTAARRLIGEGVDTLKDYVTDGGANTFTKDVAGDVAKSLTDISDFAIDKFAKARLNDVSETKRSVVNFKEGLGTLLTLLGDATDLNLPFYVFLDELDRCKPTYAISMLERVKHLFDVTGVVFILATDTDQLAHAINSVYGDKFDAKHYLQRFFHRSYQMPDADPYLIALDLITKRKLQTNKWNLPPNNDLNDGKSFAKFLAKTATILKLSPRRIDQSIDILQDVTTVWYEKFPIELTVMYPLICQYSIDRKIDGDSIFSVDRNLLNSSHWRTKNENNMETDFAAYYRVYRELWSDGLYSWIRNKSQANTIGMEESYIYENAKVELNEISSKNNRSYYTSLVRNYGDIILSNRTTFYE